MKIAIRKEWIKVHCSINLIVKLIHPLYTDAQIIYIIPFLKAAIKCDDGISLFHYTVKGGDGGWYYVKYETDGIDNVPMLHYHLVSKLCKSFCAMHYALNRFT